MHPLHARKLVEAEAADSRVRPVITVICYDAVSIGQQIVQQTGGHSLNEPLKMVAKRNGVLIHCSSVDQAAYTKIFHRLAYPVAGHAPIKVQKLMARWLADSLVASITAKLQEEAKQGVDSADRGVAPAQNDKRCQQQQHDVGNHGGNQPGGIPRSNSKDQSGRAAVNEVSKQDCQKWIISGADLRFYHFLQQYPQRSGCYACYGRFEGNHAREKDCSHDHRIWKVCGLFVNAEQQTSKARLLKPVRTPVAILGSLGVCIYVPASRHWLISYSPIHLI